MSKERNIVVTTTTGQFIDELPVELVERKGIGHPDSLCDGIAERISVEYSKWCRENLGTILHHNFDKVQLVAGEADVTYGHGQMITPIRIQIAGRGLPTYQGKMVPMDTIAIEAARMHLQETLRYLDPVKHVVIDSYAGRGVEELQYTVNNNVANDTSFGVSHWPRSVLENAVYETAQYINYELIDQFPIGEDVKVMGARRGKNIVLTVAMPLIGPKVKDATEYVEVCTAAEQAIQVYAQGLSAHDVRVDVNTADDVENDAVYLTLTGTSAEHGDDGSVGRGNRVNGVIAPFRSASLEAAAGKNPVTHVGKLYNLLALEASKAIVAQVPEVRAATVYILSQIGHQLDEPLVATASIDTQNGHVNPKVEGAVTEVLDVQLQSIDELRERILRQELPIC
jgi:S-adenosylmethionine synthetase